MRKNCCPSFLVAILGLCFVVQARAQAPAAKPDSPVERPIAGDWGMSFAFGGLAPLSVGGLTSHGPGAAVAPLKRLFFTEVGMRYMLDDRWALPFSVGIGMMSFNPSSGGSETDVGLSASVGFQRYFRIWRRIAPFFGAKLHIHYVDPTGDQNYLVQFAVGPVLGIEYFIGDRVSLAMQYELMIGVNVQDSATTVGLQSIVAMGGSMALSFYF
jgi:hypothetical protein